MSRRAPPARTPPRAARAESPRSRTPRKLPEPPEPMTLPALQAYVRAVVEIRNFTRERDKLLVLLVEEVGELAAECRLRALAPERSDPANLAYEIIDILLYLLDLANGFGLELISQWPEDERAARPASGVALAPSSSEPEGPAAPGGDPEGGPALNELARLAGAKRANSFESESEELLLLSLSEAVGNLAREVRKSWKGREDRQRAAAEIVAALRHLFALGSRFRMDFEAALAAKEKENAARTWTF